MALYNVSGTQYESSLYGLVISGDSVEKNVFFLQPFDKRWEKYFSSDAKWIASGNNKAIIVYTDEGDPREVARLVYLYWDQVDDPDNDEMEVELKETDRAYLNGLLAQWFGIEIDE